MGGFVMNLANHKQHALGMYMIVSFLTLLAAICCTVALDGNVLALVPVSILSWAAWLGHKDAKELWNL